MPTFFRMMEVLSCSMAGFLPYMLLVIYPFRNHLRLKNFLAGLLTFAIAPAVLYYDMASALGTAPTAIPYMLVRSAALPVFAVLGLPANIGKVLLDTLMLSTGKQFEMTEQQKTILIESVSNALANPYQMTQSVN